MSLICPTEAITIGYVVGVEDVLRTVLSDRIFYEVSEEGHVIGRTAQRKAFTPRFYIRLKPMASILQLRHVVTVPIIVQSPLLCDHLLLT